ncbi:MAG: hypothetical protein M3N54_07160 [Acidobacteriota bacterium]|nr:hypothetical protein [Acidobacteriota bacterium]
MRLTTAERLSISHGAFNLASGLWPVFNRRSFEVVTGPKEDFWLVRTVGLLLAVTGTAMAGSRKRVTPEIRLLGTGVAGSLATIGVIYGTKGRISRIYLLDAVAQSTLAAAWLKFGDKA